LLVHLFPSSGALGADVIAGPRRAWKKGSMDVPAKRRVDLKQKLSLILSAVFTENLIRVADVMESPKLAE